MHLRAWPILSIFCLVLSFSSRFCFSLPFALVHSRLLFVLDTLATRGGSKHHLVCSSSSQSELRIRSFCRRICSEKQPTAQPSPTGERITAGPRGESSSKTQLILSHGDEEGGLRAQEAFSATQPATAKEAAPNSPKTSESHPLRRNTSDVGGIGKPLGKSPAPSEMHSPRATAGQLCTRTMARFEIFR